MSISTLQDSRFQYSSAYLWWAIHKMELTKQSEFQLLVFDIQNWLSDNVVQDGVPLYKWSDGKLVSTFDYASFNGRTNICKPFSNVLYFKHEEDLLAFRLRFGISI